MNIVVVGCGKVGSSLARKLQRDGHDVAVVDEVEERFERLGESFDGITVAGVPFDEEVLKAAGIEGCDALAAVTQDDNINIMVGQVARELFSVPTVITRIYDPARKDVFVHFGLHTVCPTNISVDAIYSMLTGRDQVKNVYLDSATVSFDADEPDAKEIGLTLGELVLRNNAKQGLFGLLHADGNLTLAHPNSNEEVGPDDRLLYAKVID